jgi:hypothetical protein
MKQNLPVPRVWIISRFLHVKGIWYHLMMRYSLLELVVDALLQGKLTNVILSIHEELVDFALQQGH